MQVQGKFRGTVTVARGTSQDAVKEAALAIEAVTVAIAGKTVVKVIFVPDRMLNLVVK